MITATEARKRLEENTPLYKHLEEKMTHLIEMALKNGYDYVNYDLDAFDEFPYWKNHTREQSCHIVCDFVKKFGYKVFVYADRKRVQVQW